MAHCVLKRCRRSIAVSKETLQSIARFEVPALTGCRTFRTGDGSFCGLGILLHVGLPSVALVSCCRHCALQADPVVVKMLKS